MNSSELPSNLATLTLVLGLPFLLFAGGVRHFYLKRFRERYGRALLDLFRDRDSWSWRNHLRLFRFLRNREYRDFDDPNFVAFSEFYRLVGKAASLMLLLVSVAAVFLLLESAGTPPPIP